MASYASRLTTQIDTTGQFYVIGASLGGMIATELTDLIHPDLVIVVSSAKCRDELPARYRFQQSVPIHSLFSGEFLKKASYIAQPIFEPERNLQKETHIAMLDDMDPVFLKRSVEMIIDWEREDFDPNIIHIHGEKDHTLPIRNVAYDYYVDGGSHMMMLTRTGEIQQLLNTIIDAHQKKGGVL